ncbi:hypothetical protein [Bacteroides uniformis]|uniref:hypothetical protein n=1 Tax=Bacteroides uniformis TaxID=820 RepID=UPI00155EF66A|nr:hypothetical protein [Bacteroides uniformis]
MVADVTPGYHLKARIEFTKEFIKEPVEFTKEFIKEPVGFIKEFVKALLKYTPKPQ